MSQSTKKGQGFRPSWIVVHTAADPREGGSRDTTAAEIDLWHKARGWSGIGYHYLVRRNGQIQNGRSENQIGAHAAGVNGVSLGVCLSGHGDLQPMTEAQYQSLIRLLVQLCRRHGIPADRIVGHREIYKIDPAARTTKTCPGSKVPMDQIRESVRLQLQIAQGRPSDPSAVKGVSKPA